LEDLIAFMKAGGKIPRIILWKGSGIAPWAIIEGQMRFIAAQRQGWTHIEAEIVDCTLEEAKTRAFTSNNQNKPLWIDTDLASAERFKELKTQGVTQEALAGRLGKSPAKINNAIKIARVLTPAAKELVDQNLQKTLKNDIHSVKSKNKGFLITEHHLVVLADLEDPEKFEKALQIVLDDYLTESETKQRVQWVKDGHDPEEFGKHPAKKETAKTTEPSSSTASEVKPKPETKVVEAQPVVLPSSPGEPAEQNGEKTPKKRKTSVRLWATLLIPGALLAVAWYFQSWWISHQPIKSSFTPLVVMAPAAPPTVVPPPVSAQGRTRIAPRVKKHSDVVKRAKTPTSTSLTSNSNPVSTSSVPATSSPASSGPLENQRDMDSAFVLKFAQALYSIGYLNYQDRETTLLGWVTKDFAGDLKGHYFNPYVLKNMESIHRTKTFTPDGPVKWVFSNETTEEFMVSGTIDLQGGWNGQGSNSTKQVTARIDIIHDTQGQALVKEIKETITP
jgi:hypothetical protein